MKWKVLWFIVLCAHASQAMEPSGVYNISSNEFNDPIFMKELMQKCDPAHIVIITVEAQNSFFTENMSLSSNQFNYPNKIERLIITDPNWVIKSTDWNFLTHANFRELELSFPNLVKIGDRFMNNCTKLEKLKLFFPNLQSIPADFFKGSKVRAIEVLPQTIEIFKKNLGDRVESIEEKDGIAYIYLRN